MDLRHFMEGRAPLGAGSKLIFAGLALIIVGVLLLKLTHHDLFWTVLVLGLALATKGGIDESQLP